MKKAILTLLLLLLPGFFAWSQNATVIPEALRQKLLREGFSLVRSPIKAPEFNVKDLSGTSVPLNSLKGRIVFLNFWATWCPPCRIEMPSMERLSKILADDKFTIMAVSQGENPQTVRRFVESQKFTFPIYTDEGNVTALLYGISAIPTTFLLDKEGFVIGAYQGAREWDEEEIINLFKELASL